MTALWSTPTSSAAQVEHPAGRLTRADAELEHPLGVDTGGGVGDGVLLVVRRHLHTDRLQVAGRIEVELVTIGCVDHGCSLAGAQQTAAALDAGSLLGGSGIYIDLGTVERWDQAAGEPGRICWRQ
jgi:hypothetical protein